VTPVGKHRADADAASDPVVMFFGIQQEDLANAPMLVALGMNKANFRNIGDRARQIGCLRYACRKTRWSASLATRMVPRSNNFKRQYNEIVFESARPSCHSFRVSASDATDEVHRAVSTKSGIHGEVFRRPSGAPSGHTAN